MQRAQRDSTKHWILPAFVRFGPEILQEPHFASRRDWKPQSTQMLSARRLFQPGRHPRINLYAPKARGVDS